MRSYLFECIDCRKHYAPDEVEYVCPECAREQQPMQPLKGLLRCIYDYESIARQFDADLIAKREELGFDRWMELLPLESADALPPLITAATPLRPAPKLGDLLGLEELWLKDDTGLPTGSFKDRASALVVACAYERDRETVATASTGNAATALAGQCASMEMESVIFVPESAPMAKLTQIAVYGGKLIPVRGSYDDCFELSLAACERFGWYNRNTAYNPFTVEGKKTAALEIWEQLEFETPDWVIVPTGDGVILAGIEKGFSDLAALGLIERVPRLAAVQAAGCAPIVDAVASGSTTIIPEMKPETVADSIRVGVPRAGHWALQALASTNGVAVAVDDEAILEAIALIGRSSGVFAEPAAAASIAGAQKLAQDGIIAPDEVVVALITGNGLKDVPAAAKAVSFPKPIEATIEGVQDFIDQSAK